MNTPTTSFRLDPELLAAAKTLADREERSVAWVVDKALREYLDHDDHDRNVRHGTTQYDSATQGRKGKTALAAK